MRKQIKLYQLSWSAVRRLPGWARYLHSLLWLRVLDQQDVTELTVNSYDSSSGFDGEEHNFGGLWPWEEKAIRGYFASCRNILVAGAGGGREMIALARMGFSVAGFDASADLTRACARNLRVAGVPAEIHEAPANLVPQRLGIYDGLVVGRGVYHHIAGRDSRINFLAACREHLRPGSPMVIGDFLTRRSRRRWPAMISGREIGDSVGSAFFHYFSRSEIVSEVEAAGFDVVECPPEPFAQGKMAHVIAKSAAS